MWTKVPHLDQGTDDDNTKQTQTLAMICEQYLPEAWTNVYTDGSATNVIQDSWYCHLLPSRQHSTSQCSNTKTQHQLQSRVRGIDDGHLSWCRHMTEEPHGCISHWWVLPVLTNNTFPHIAKALQLLHSVRGIDRPRSIYPPKLLKAWTGKICS